MFQAYFGQHLSFLVLVCCLLYHKADAVHDESSEVLEDSCHIYDPAANMDFSNGNSS